MTISTPARRHAPARIVPGNIVVAAYLAALGLSAALLFGIQPMFAKMVLPRLGGSASVWSVAMVFFQTMLLAGYLYAHLLMRHFGFRSAVAIHLCVIAITFIGLPVRVAEGFRRPPADWRPRGCRPPAGGRASLLAYRPVHGVRRRALLRGRRKRAAVAGLVRSLGAPRRPKSLFPLRRVPHRFVRLAARLSPDR